MVHYDKELKFLKRLFTKEKQENLPLLEILQTFQDFYDDPIMYSRDFNIWIVLKNLNEKEWEFEKFNEAELEKILRILVDLFYKTDIKGTTNYIKAILSNLIKFKPDLKPKVKKNPNYLYVCLFFMKVQKFRDEKKAKQI